MQQRTIFKILIYISFAECLDVTGNVTVRILEYVKNGRSVTQSRTASSYIFPCITDPFAIVNKYTGRIRVIIQVRIHTANDIVSERFLVILRHFGKFLVRPIRFVLQVLIDLVIPRDNRNVRIRGVYFNNVKYLTACPVLIVEHHFGLNRSPGYKYVIFLRDYVVVTICTKTSTRKYYIVVFPVRDSCGCSNWQKANQRQRKHHQHHEPYNCFSHKFISFFACSISAYATPLKLKPHYFFIFVSIIF